MTTEMLPIWEDDTARARKTDPVSSHVAADRSAGTRGRVHEAVLWMLAHYGPLNGRQLNDHYRHRQRGTGWPVVDYDSPRKRVAELVGTHVYVTNPDDPRGTPAVYALKEES